MDTIDLNNKGCEQGTHAECCDFPEFKRLNYFHGQLLGFQDFRTEQAYFREKLKLHNRCLHGYGTVCGLMVRPEPGEHVCEPDWTPDYKILIAKLEKSQLEKKALLKEGKTTEAGGIQAEIEKLTKQLEKYPACELPPNNATQIRIECGMALDCLGNELLVRRPLTVNLWQSLTVEDQKKIKDGATTLYISLCHSVLPIEPMRPVLQSACAVIPECVSGKLLDSVCVKVTVNPPSQDQRCETCCSNCHDPCLLLALIDGYQPGLTIQPGQISNSVRRLISTYPYTTITGISWTHGGVYNEDQVKQLLGTDESYAGLKIQFSRPILVSTLKEGLVDLWVVQGGKTKAADIYSLEVELNPQHSDSLTTDALRIRYVGDEDLDPGDRVLIVIRTAFILDECCRPVDGVHVGGRIPIITEAEFKPFDQSAPFSECIKPPSGYGPWTSGTGYPGANFESWFYIAKREHKTISKKAQTKEVL